MKTLIHCLCLCAAFVAMCILIPDMKAAQVVTVTSYNPHVSQTDDGPCVGASSRNLCRAAREGDRVIALSRDLLARWGGPYRWHDKVKLTSDVPQCNGVFSVEDTLHRRFTNRADLFFLDRADNTSCTAALDRAPY